MEANLQIFNYLDYRAYLRDVISHRRTQGKPLSLTALGKKAGGYSKAQLSLVLAGKRNVSTTKISSLASALQLQSRALKYFHSLVLLNQAQSPAEKEFHLERLNSLQPIKGQSRLLKDQYGVLSNWHCIVIRELVRLPNFDPAPAALSRRFKGRLSVAEARTAMETLLRTGLVLKEGESYRVSADFIESSDGIQSLAIQSYHKSCLALGQQIIETVPVEKRHFHSLNLTLTESEFEAIKQKLSAVRDEISQLEARAEGKAGLKVYQLNTQLFEIVE